ncbi:MAG: hypothetical protein ACUVXF_11580 [Desulfobaccales bacterium]
MRMVLILLMGLLLALPAWGQAQGGSFQKSNQQTNSQQSQQTQKKSGLEQTKEKIKPEIKKRQHEIKTPQAVTGVRG